jgi:hypothetical protein
MDWQLPYYLKKSYANHLRTDAVSLDYMLRISLSLEILACQFWNKGCFIMGLWMLCHFASVPFRLLSTSPCPPPAYQ